MTIYQNILVAVDLKDDSLAIGQRARALATALGAELDLMHVVEPIPPIAAIQPEGLVPDMLVAQSELIAMARQKIGDLARELGVPAARVRVLTGDVKTEIGRDAQEHHADLIFIGSHERHGLAFLIKPTEDVVVRRAPCDVLAVRLRDQAKKN